MAGTLSDFAMPSYNTVDASMNGVDDIRPPGSWTEVNVGDWLATHAAAIQPKTPLSRDLDLFRQGFDR